MKPGQILISFRTILHETWALKKKMLSVLIMCCGKLILVSAVTHHCMT